MEDLIKLIGKSAKMKRLEKNMSQEKLAELCGISLASITRFETGRGNISLQNLLAIFKVLELSDAIKSIFTGDEAEEDVQSHHQQKRVRWSKKRNIPHADAQL